MWTTFLPVFCKECTYCFPHGCSCGGVVALSILGLHVADDQIVQPLGMAWRGCVQLVLKSGHRQTPAHRRKMTMIMIMVVMVTVMMVMVKCAYRCMRAHTYTHTHTHTHTQTDMKHDKAEIYRKQIWKRRLEGSIMDKQWHLCLVKQD